MSVTLSISHHLKGRTKLHKKYQQNSKNILYCRYHFIAQLICLHRDITVAEHVGIRYVANIQFKQDTHGEFKLLRINPRFPGTLPLTTAAGIDIPQLLIQDIQGMAFPEGLMPFKELMVVRYWAENFCSTSEWESLCQN